MIFFFGLVSSVIVGFMVPRAVSGRRRKGRQLAVGIEGLNSSGVGRMARRKKEEENRVDERMN